MEMGARNYISKIPIFALLLMIVAGVYGATVNVTVSLISPSNTVLANTSFSVICPNYTNTSLTNSTGVAVVAVPNVTNCLVIVPYNNSTIIGVLNNTTVNATYTINASTYNVTNISVECPKELTVNVTFNYTALPNLTKKFDLPATLYIEPFSNVTLTFPNHIKKGVFYYDIEKIEVNGKNYTNTDNVTINPAVNNTVKVKYMKVMAMWMAFLIIFLIIAILLIALKTSGRLAVGHVLNKEFNYARKR